MNQLYTHYQKSIRANLVNKFGYANVHNIPKLTKIIIHTGLGLKAQNKAMLQKAIDDIRQITGQQPIITLAKESIANFKVREHNPIGLKVTLRRNKMYSFIERLRFLALPGIRDFQGLNPKAFDLSGNYNFGITDHFIFPEMSFDSAQGKQGLNITICTTARTNREGFWLLKEMGLPFKVIN